MTQKFKVTIIINHAIHFISKLARKHFMMSSDTKNIAENFTLPLDRNLQQANTKTEGTILNCIEYFKTISKKMGNRITTFERK